MNTTGYVQAQNQYANLQNAAIGNQALGATLPVLEAQVNRLGNSAKDVEDLATRLHALADRLFGPLANGEKVGASSPSPSHAIGKLNDAHEWLERARLNLGAAVARLDAL